MLFRSIPSVDDLANGTPYRVARYNTWDLQLGRSFSNSSNRWLKGLSFNVGINNLSNQMPPLIPSEGNQSHDIVSYDAVGRFIYFQAKYKF